MSLNVHTDIELAPPRHRKGACPFMVVFDKRSRPDNRGGIKQVYLLASLKTQRERRGSPGHTFPSGDPREAREHEGKVCPGRTATLLGSGLELVVVDQAAGLDDGALLGRHIGNVELNLLNCTVGAHYVRGDVL